MKYGMKLRLPEPRGNLKSRKLLVTINNGNSTTNEYGPNARLTDEIRFEAGQQIDVRLIDVQANGEEVEAGVLSHNETLPEAGQIQIAERRTLQGV